MSTPLEVRIICDIASAVDPLTRVYNKKQLRAEGFPDLDIVLLSAGAKRADTSKGRYEFNYSTARKISKEELIALTGEEFIDGPRPVVEYLYFLK
jgi:hypothetical protein